MVLVYLATKLGDFVNGQMLVNHVNISDIMHGAPGPWERHVFFHKAFPAYLDDVATLPPLGV